MSLMKTLAKVAIGVAVAKGAQSMMRGGSSGGGGLGGMLNDLTGGGRSAGGPGGRTADSTRSGSGSRTATTGGGLEDILGSVLGGARGGTGGGSGLPGGLGGLLESLGGARGASGGGLQDILGGLLGGAAAGGLTGGSDKSVQQKTDRVDKSFGEVLNSQFDATPEEEIEPSKPQEAAAALMLKAMIQAAKSDGTFDDAEREKLLGRLGGDVSQEEAAFVQAELDAPVDVEGLVSQVPEGLGPQVYAMSVLGIDLDTQAEAQYLHKLAQGLGIGPEQVNEIHARLGVPSLYA